ncbi:MAG TPA: hypothetical protein VFT45_14145 [Longimicrobium sp.]|nr:hypothetical protein [Longimicrobium sp.]
MSDIPFPPPPVPDGPMAPISPGGPDAPGGSGPGGNGDGKAAGRIMPVFKRLRRGRIETIPHGRFGFVPVDVYELASFDAVTSADERSDVASVQFYVYHQTDAMARATDRHGNVTNVSVETRDDRWHIPFEQALSLWGVDYNDDTHLGDVVVDFWSALFAAPSDGFDETSYGVSPWLERNVGDRRTVGSMRPGTAGGEWDDLKLRLRPRKTLNWPAPVLSQADRFPEEPGLIMLLEAIVFYRGGGAEGAAWDRVLSIRDRLEQQRREWGSGKEGVPAGGGAPVGAPPCVEVVQLDLNTVGLRLLEGGPPEVGVMVLLHS